MSDDIFFSLVMDDSDATAKLAALAQRADEVAAKEVAMRRQVNKTARHAATLAMSVIGFMRNVFSLAGYQLDALQQAILLSVEQIIATATAWFALQAAMLTNPATAVIGGIGLIASGAALGVVLGQTAMIAIYGDKVNSSIANMTGAIHGLEGIASSIVNLAGDF